MCPKEEGEPFPPANAVSPPLPPPLLPPEGVWDEGERDPRRKGLLSFGRLCGHDVVVWGGGGEGEESSQGFNAPLPLLGLGPGMGE